MTISHFSKYIFFTFFLLFSPLSFSASLVTSIQEDQYSQYFSDAEGLLMTDAGDVYVATERNASVLKIHDKKITITSTKPDIFDDSDLSGISQFKNNHFVLLNKGSGKLAITDDHLKKINKFSDSGSKPGELDDPKALVATANNRIYVADSSNNRISVFNNQGLFLFSFGNSGPDQSLLENPTHLAIDAQENVYVLEAENANRISIYDREGKLIKQIQAAEVAGLINGEAPDFSAMTADLNGVIYFADYDSRQVVSYDWKLKKKVESFGSLGQSQGQFREVTQLSINNKGQLAVLDVENEKVEIYQVKQTQYAHPVIHNLIHYQGAIASQCAKSYAFDDEHFLCVKPEQGIYKFDNSGKEQGVFAKEIKDPTDVYVGNTHVAIIENNFLSTYTKKGEKIFKIGRYGSSPGGFDDPIHVFAKDGLTYVADKNNNRIQIFGKDSQFKKQIVGSDDPEAAFEVVGSFAVSNDSKLYMADNNGSGTITVSDLNSGKRLNALKLGKGPYEVEKIVNLDIDQQDRIYVYAKTDSNPFSVSIWKDEQILHRFGSAKDNGIKQSLENLSNISVLSTDKNNILLNDSEAQKLHTYNFQEIPTPAFGLKIDANKSQVKLHWSLSGSNLVASYVVEGADKQGGNFKPLATTKNNEITFPDSKVKNITWFRVVSVSGHGLKAKPSKAKENEFKSLAILFDFKQYKSVINKANKLLALHSDNADLLSIYADSLFLNKDYRDAIPAYKKLAKFKNYKNKALKAQVESYFALEEYLDAKSLIDEVLAAQPKEVGPYLLCTELSLKLADAIGAVTCAEDGLNLHDNHVKLRYLLGKAYIAAGITDQGLMEYETVITNKPQNIPIRLLIANDLYDLKKYDEALAHFDIIESERPDSFEAKKGKAKVLIALERFDEAKTLAIALTGNRKSKAIQADGYYFLGQIAFNNRKYTEAVLRLTRASKFNAKAIDAWSLLARSYIELNQLPRGVKTLNQGINKNPEAFQLYETLGEIELEQEHYLESSKASSKAVSLNPTSLNAQKLLAKSLFLSRVYSKAAKHASQAAKIAPKDIDVLVLQADIAALQGKVGSAIEYLKTAISIKPSSADLQFRLGRIYQDANIYDSSKQHLEKAAGINPSWSAPHVALGDLYLKRRLFDQSIAAYEKAIDLDPSEDNRSALNVAFAEQKRALEFKNNAPQIVLKDLNLTHVFSAAYKKYQDKPIGQVTIDNISATDYGDLSLSFQIKEYMDFPAVQKIDKLHGSSSKTFDINAVFNNKILQVDEDTGVQVEVKLSYLRDGQKDDIVLTQAMTIYGKNAMVWGDPAMVGSFVTPKDDTLRNFVRQVINKYRPKEGPLNANLVSAMAYFSSISALGTKYVVDPNTPYASLKDDTVDYVQFPRETLRLRSGDCDDLSVLLSAGLENLGIKTVLLEVPGHLLMMFDTGLKTADASLISRDFSLLAEKDGTVWIPVEATMIANSFTEAWAEGARKYQKAVKENNLGLITLSDAWGSYKPVTLEKADFKAGLPDDKQVKKLVDRDRQVLLTKSIDRLVLPYQALVATNPSNISARMQIAILYSRYGLAVEAEQAFDELTELAPENSAVFNNKGNFLLLQNKPKQAISAYKIALEKTANDGDILINLAMAYYESNQLKLASQSYKKAVSAKPSLAKKYNAFAKLLSN